jgi:hypothetical protein
LAVDRRHALGLLVVVILSACGHEPPVEDPVPGVPQSRQRTISRAELGFRWPLTVGVGTLACDSTGAILFRSGGVTYVVSGTRPDARPLGGLRIPEASPPPSNPLKRLPQSQRMDAFESMLQCESRERVDEACRRRTFERFGLSPQEWALIDVEGRERAWPPLTRGLMPLDAMITAGRALCADGAGQ